MTVLATSYNGRRMSGRRDAPTATPSRGSANADAASEAAAPAPSTVRETFQLYGRYVGNLAYRILGDAAEADDVVQDVFVQVVRYLPALREQATVKTWIGRITVRLARQRLRRRRLRRLLRWDDVPRFEPQAPGMSADDRVLLDRIFEVVGEVPANHRIAWSLRHLEGEPLEVVAQLCECSLATAKRRIATTHARIMKAFDER